MALAHGVENAAGDDVFTVAVTDAQQFHGRFNEIFYAMDFLDIKDPLTDHLIDQVAPVANRLDREPAMLFSAFKKLGQTPELAGWRTPKVPDGLGGLGFDAESYGQFQSLIAQHSGALAFLLTQHQSAASLVLAGENEALKQTTLPAMATGEVCMGVGFSQLRRQPPALVAQRVAEGYRLSGEVPWVSGSQLFTAFVGGAVVRDTQDALFGLLPLVSTRCDGGEIVVSDPMALCAVSATSTVRVVLTNWLLPQNKVLGLRPAGWLATRDRANPLSPLALMFGCTQASIASVRQSLARRHIDHDMAERLAAQLAKLRQELAQTVVLPTSAYDQKLALRGKAISLMNTAAQAAIISASGAANTLGHPAQRIYRESLLFSVSGQTNEGAIASLESLTFYL